MKDFNELSHEELVALAESQRLLIARLKEALNRELSNSQRYYAAAEQHWRNEEAERGRQGIFG